MVGDKRPMDDDDEDDGLRESKRQRRPASGRKMENDWHGSGKIRKLSGAIVNKEDRYRAVKEQKTPDLMSASKGALTADFVQRLISAMEPLLHENLPTSAHATQDGDRAGWTTSRDQFFINLLLEQTSRGRRTEVGFTKDAWKSIFLAFNKRFNLNYTISQLKSRYRRLKTQYRMIKALRNLNGFGWDDELKVVTASEDVWEQYISEHPDARNYKSKYFPFYDECAILFDGKRIEGHRTMVEVHNGLMHEDVSAAVNTDALYSTDEASSEDATPYEVLEQHKHGDTTSCSSHEKRVCSSPRHRIAVALENIAFEFADSRIVQKMASEDDVSFRQCVVELQSMEGLDPEDCVKAVTILKDPLNRVAFATLNEDLRRRWLISELDQFK
ncbi:unnamed protein product [Victoria cruziana]